MRMEVKSLLESLLSLHAQGTTSSQGVGVRENLKVQVMQVWKLMCVQRE